MDSGNLVLLLVLEKRKFLRDVDGQTAEDEDEYDDEDERTLKSVNGGKYASLIVD